MFCVNDKIQLALWGIAAAVHTTVATVVPPAAAVPLTAMARAPLPPAVVNQDIFAPIDNVDVNVPEAIDIHQSPPLQFYSSGRPIHDRIKTNHLKMVTRRQSLGLLGEKEGPKAWLHVAYHH